MTKTNLYLVSRLDYGYDEHDAHVVRATSERNALDMCNEDSEDWRLATAVLVEESGQPGFILSSYNTG